MVFRQLDVGGIEMDYGKLGFGLMRLPLTSENNEDIDIEKLKDMVDAFMEGGLTYFDTSHVYHNGASQSAIRKALVERYPRERYTLATKLPDFFITAEEQVEEIFAEQLEQCGVSYFDYYLIHNVNELLYKEPVTKFHMFEHELEWKKQGKINNLGLSFHDSAEVLDKILTEHPEIDFVQIVLNYYDWNSAFIQSGKCYDVIQKHGKKVVVMQPVKAGTLANVPEEIQIEMEKINPEASAASYALRYAAQKDDVISVLSGMSTLEQVKDNVETFQNFEPLSEAEEKLLRKAVIAYQKQWKYQSNYWNEIDAVCPKNIPISAIIKTYNSLQLQPNPFGGAELNYYRNAVKRTCPASDCIHCGKCKEIEKVFDVEAVLQEAAIFEEQHAFKESHPAYEL